jgi:hypothetical protein
MDWLFQHLNSIEVGHWRWPDFGLGGIAAILMLTAFSVYAILFFRNRPRGTKE